VIEIVTCVVVVVVVVMVMIMALPQTPVVSEQSR